MLPGDRLICAFVEPQIVGFQFKSWPLHVTVMPWFRLDGTSQAVAGGLSQAFKAIEPFEAVGEGVALFGPKKNRPVRLLKQPTPFAEVEAKSRNYFHKKQAWLVDETTKRRREFRPHVTNQGEHELHENDIFYCDRLFIIEQKGEHKEIAAEVLLHV